MPKRASERISRVARALLSDPAEEELFREAGRAIIRLSDIENLLVMLFTILSNHIMPDEASKLFYEQGTFERRLNLVDFIIRKWNRPKEMALWSVIIEDLQKHKGVRNLIAHQGMFRHPPDKDGRQAVSLQPPWMKTSGKGRYLNANEIRSTGDALEDVRRDLWALINILHDEPEAGED